jgi:hypothetical protein
VISNIQEIRARRAGHLGVLRGDSRIPGLDHVIEIPGRDELLSPVWR